MVVARKIANANPAMVNGYRRNASALVFPAPAGNTVVGEPSKWLAVDPNFQQLPAIESINLESLERSERSLVANFRIKNILRQKSVGDRLDFGYVSRREAGKRQISWKKSTFQSKICSLV